MYMYYFLNPKQRKGSRKRGISWGVLQEKLCGVSSEILQIMSKKCCGGSYEKYLSRNVSEIALGVPSRNVSGNEK